MSLSPASLERVNACEDALLTLEKNLSGALRNRAYLPAHIQDYVRQTAPQEKEKEKSTCALVRKLLEDLSAEEKALLLKRVVEESDRDDGEHWCYGALVPLCVLVLLTEAEHAPREVHEAMLSRLLMYWYDEEEALEWYRFLQTRGLDMAALPREELKRMARILRRRTERDTDVFCKAAKADILPLLPAEDQRYRPAVDAQRLSQLKQEWHRAKCGWDGTRGTAEALVAVLRQLPVEDLPALIMDK